MAMTQKRMEEIARILERKWQEISHDMFLDEEGKMDYSKTFERDEMTSCCADFVINDEIPWKEWAELTQEERKIIAHLAFPDDLYGY